MEQNSTDPNHGRAEDGVAMPPTYSSVLSNIRSARVLPSNAFLRT